MKIIYETPKIYKIINDCINYAIKSPCVSKHTSVILNGKKIIDKGFYNNINHAEVSCLNYFFKKYKNEYDSIALTIFVIRINNKGELMNSKPCVNCYIELKKFLKKYKNPKHVIYSNEFNELICENLETFTTTHYSKKNRNK